MRKNSQQGIFEDYRTKMVAIKPMRKNILTVLLFGMTIASTAQNASVEKSVSGIQIGFLGVWGFKEARLTDQLALRSELGFDAGIWGGSFYSQTGYLFTPVITAEPRWYFNLDKRVSKSRRIDGNRGNFLSLKTSFHPDWFVISNYDNINIISDLSVVPTWGIRRGIGNHINFETGIGIGYRYIFAKNAGYLDNVGEVAANLHLRLGYQF